MGFAVLLTSGFFGFLAATVSGLIFGLTWAESLGVYFVAGLIVAFTIFAARALFCAAARQMA